jgi:dephospho-CoA kinase
MGQLAIAVTGGIGAGKTEALRAFARRGIPTLSSDEVVHRLIAEDPEIRAALEERFGTTERPRIAEIVFADPVELAWLEALIHPRVGREERRWRAGQDEVPVIVEEIPLLYESGAEERFDAVVVVTAPEEVRATRTNRLARSFRLLPDEEKVRRADFVYVNDGTLEELDTFVGSVLERLAPA